MSEVEFVNVYGKPVCVAPQPKKRTQKEGPDSFHKGFSVQGHPPGALEAAEALHKKTGEGKFDSERWLTKTRLKKVRSKPYSLLSAAEECKNLAEKAGWLCVVVVAVSRGAAA